MPARDGPKRMFIDRQVAEVAISSEPSIAEVLRMRRTKREEREKAAADGPTLLTGRTDVIDPDTAGSAYAERRSRSQDVRNSRADRRGAAISSEPAPPSHRPWAS